MRYRVLVPLAQIALAGQSGTGRTSIRRGMEERAGTQPELDATDARGRSTAPSASRPQRGRVGQIGTRREMLAGETLRLYAADWSRFCEYCFAAGARALPAAPETVAAFLQMPGPGRA